MDWGQVSAVCGVFVAGLAGLWKSIDLSIANAVASLKTEVATLKDEIQSLRKWRHDQSGKLMMLDDHERRIGNLEEDVRKLQRKGD